MKKLWQTEWFGIRFNDFIEYVDSKNIANEKFYEKFYEKFKSYDELPEKYKSNKIGIAKDIIGFSKDYSEIMSIGCGNGIIENYIVMNSDKSIIAIEPSNNSKWLNNQNKVKFISGFFPSCIADEKKYTIGYCSSIDYVFNDDEYVSFFKSVYDYKFEKFYLTEVITPPINMKSNLKYLIKGFLSNLGIYKHKGQFWGYLRTIDEHIDLLKKTGFKTIDYGKHQHGNYWIKVENE